MSAVGESVGVEVGMDASDGSSPCSSSADLCITGIAIATTPSSLTATTEPDFPHAALARYAHICSLLGMPTHAAYTGAAYTGG